MKVYVTLITAVLSIGLMIATASSQTQQTDSQKIKYAEMVEDIEIMCRIIDKTMKENFTKEYQGSGFFGRQGCQGFYLKNYGVVFNLEVQFPVADKEIKVVKEKKKNGNWWDEFEREVRRQPHLEDTQLITEKSKSYDTDKVNKLKAKLAYLIGEYGMRIGQLESDDMISIVIFGRSGRSPNAVVWNSIGEGNSWVIDDLASVHLKDQILEQMEDAKVHLEFEIEKHIEDETERIQDEKERIKKEIRVKIHSEVEAIEEDVEEEELGHPKIKTRTVIVPKMRNVIVRALNGALSPRISHFNLQSKPTMTMILTFNRSMLKNKKGSDWKKILEDADIVQY